MDKGINTWFSGYSGAGQAGVRQIKAAQPMLLNWVPSLSSQLTGTGLPAVEYLTGEVK